MIDLDDRDKMVEKKDPQLMKYLAKHVGNGNYFETQRVSRCSIRT